MSVLENTLLSAGLCVTATVQWHATPLFLTYIYRAQMFFLSGYFEFPLWFRLTEAPGTSLSLSSSLMCILSEVSMI